MTSEEYKAEIDKTIAEAQATIIQMASESIDEE